MSSLRPILSALSRHRIAALLIVLEVALAFAIVSNAVYLVLGRLERMRIDPGIDVPGLVVMQMSTLGGHGGVASGEADLAALRAIPGVRHAAISNQMPFTSSSYASGYTTRPGAQGGDNVAASVYFGGPGLLRTLGVHVVAGRDFVASEYSDITPATMMQKFFNPPVALVTRAFAERMWPGESAVGRVMYSGNTAVRIVGVISNLMRPYVGAQAAGDPVNFWTVVMPYRAGPQLGGWYALRTAPAERQRVLEAARARLMALHPQQTLSNVAALSGLRAKYFRNDRAMSWLLAGSVLALLAVTAVGIVGLASFWVQQRARQIGVRRALGARRVDVLRYFQIENFLLATAGIVLGCAAAIGINVWLMAHYQVQRLPLAYLPLGALALWLLGQLAVLGPALRAMRIAPSRVMRAA